MAGHKGSVLDNQPVMVGTSLMRLHAPELARAARPGQFAMVHCGQGQQPLWRRPLSLHRVDATSSEVALLYAVVGQGTRWLSSRQPGDEIDLLGPLGRGYTLPEEPGNLLMVAGGRGIAPLVFLAEVALARGHSVTLLHGAAGASSLYPTGLLPPGLRLVQATEDGSRGQPGLATQVLPGLLGVVDQVYACGPQGMYQALAGLGLRVPIQVLVEAPMACGFGGCYGCAVNTRHGIRLACRDGPCFPLEELLWPGSPKPITG